MDEEACSQGPIVPLKVVRGLYIRICDTGFSKLAPRIGNENRTTDWDIEEYNGRIEQNLNHWTQYLSSVLLHSVIRLELGCKLLTSFLRYKDERLANLLQRHYQVTEKACQGSNVQRGIDNCGRILRRKGACETKPVCCPNCCPNECR